MFWNVKCAFKILQDIMYLYLIINIAAFIIPFLYSFEKKMNFIKNWKSVFLSIAIVAIPFLIWDVYFTKIGVWGFNSSYYLGFKIFGLPFEEVMFFFCIPYASIFTHYSLLHFFPNLTLSKKTTKTLSLFLLLIAVLTLSFNTDKWYTFVDFTVFALLILYSIKNNGAILSKFYITFLVVLIPFFVVNGVLTGSFIEGEVVWYNNNENLGIRIGTIPVEDFFYAFSMLFAAIVLNEKLKLKFQK